MQEELKEMIPKVGDRKVLSECLAPIRKASMDAKVAAYMKEQKKVIMKFKEEPVRNPSESPGPVSCRLNF